MGQVVFAKNLHTTQVEQIFVGKSHTCSPDAEKLRMGSVLFVLWRWRKQGIARQWPISAACAPSPTNAVESPANMLTVHIFRPRARPFSVNRAFN